jgi:hypothetical protein
MCDSSGPSESVCLTPGCSRPVKTRGLCQACYSKANASVNEGVVSWEKLVELGLAKPSARDKGSGDLWLKAFADAVQREQQTGQPTG